MTTYTTYTTQQINKAIKSVLTQLPTGSLSRKMTADVLLEFLDTLFECDDLAECSCNDDYAPQVLNGKPQ